MPMFAFVLKIPIAVSGIRGMGFLMKYHMEGGGNLPPKLSNLFIKVRLFMVTVRWRSQTLAWANSRVAVSINHMWGSPV